MILAKPQLDLSAEYTTEQTAEILKISASTLRKHTWKGDIYRAGENYLGKHIIQFWQKRMMQAEKLVKSKYTHKHIEEVDEMMFDAVVTYFEDVLRYARDIAERIGLDTEINWIHEECEEQLDDIIQLAKQPSSAWADADNDLEDEFQSAYERTNSMAMQRYDDFLERVASDIAEVHGEAILNKMTTAYLRGY